MYTKNDLDFINNTFQILIQLFNYRQTLNTKHFFTNGLAEGKLFYVQIELIL